jgi:L-threonylcarbamoyladenylate synthase
VPEVAWDIIDLATRPTTVILNGAVNLAPNLLAEDGSVGLRVTSEVFSQQLCYRFQKAIVSTSANISGQPSPQTFADISPAIINAVDYVCLSRQRDTSRHEPSSIIKLTPTGEVTIIRK